MHNALSFQRVHQPKKHVLAHYHPETNMAYTEDAKGPLFKNMGKVFAGKEDPLGPRLQGENRIWLLPEEAVYLLERGTVDIRWPVDEDEEETEGLPMSLQGAYAAFLGEEEGGLTFERYSVYAGLKRSGYTVHRAPSWDGPGDEPGEECFPPLQGMTWNLGLLRHAWRNMFIPRAATEAEQKVGPLVTPGIYRSYGKSLILPDSTFLLTNNQIAEIYRRLSIIPSYDPSTRKQGPADPTDPSFRITYHLWKPGSPHYKKSSPGTPDFRIAVVNARETTFPTLSQLAALIDTQPYMPPRSDAQLYAKLRNGHKSVILAVVDQGVTSYLRLADAGFCREKLFERKAPAARKGGKGGKWKKNKR
jgi:tRNA-splicing endonuclease subunit Sen54